MTVSADTPILTRFRSWNHGSLCLR